MSFLDTIKDTVNKLVPQKEESLPKPGFGSMAHEEDMIVSKPAIVCHAGEIFFSFLALCCFASVAAFQAKWGVGPSGLSGFSIFIALFGFFIALFMVLVPVIYEKYDKLIRLARAMKEVRSLAWTEPGCKNPNNDPNASKGDGFKNGLSGWCSTKKAGAIFFWLSTVCWIGTMTILVLDWRSGKSNPRRDPNFNPPSEMHAHEDDDEDDDESRYGHIPSNAPQLPLCPKSRPSIDAYGAFSDPTPSGFDAPAPASPGVSRTMQYADPYAAVRASIGGASPQMPQPPTYDYQEYARELMEFQSQDIAKTEHSLCHFGDAPTVLHYSILSIIF
ncbi:hypothetical protein JB92DRAFT_3085683 [Gautieria morchelliformis]|nr:hypothetical protein JB92DRAFT_3085683 [Gautieria morchelliformis]